MDLASQSCIGCPSSTDHTGVVVAGVVVVALGVASWGFLGRRAGVFGRVLAGALIVLGVALLVIGV